ncbi:uncharacterized protein KNAG_0F02220 [Huiozyma naganishii CBS 8797]|uniref:Uncharacterized protein n=1 Tax=Huiozyma naganishii (strain ATCC MYA-139 / BCRC 22969 / CBS 8797 / KCTC 17520 / NBRC 10181 / NCYC 3082 / Yp74L-3) TaxID=1071383 RepID=J7S7C0_HUIN7|nr:hypothetical protein KNAG_0F02220 [Kazachstania naganishii CBS 8797]CCK70889.1 hypothetical protein KNAG_0F02220 [Kazachstania naganishii CBS 8797]
MEGYFSSTKEETHDLQRFYRIQRGMNLSGRERRRERAAQAQQHAWDGSRPAKITNNTSRWDGTKKRLLRQTGGQRKSRGGGGGREKEMRRQQWVDSDAPKNRISRLVNNRRPRNKKKEGKKEKKGDAFAAAAVSLDGGGRCVKQKQRETETEAAFSVVFSVLFLSFFSFFDSCPMASPKIQKKGGLRAALSGPTQPISNTRQEVPVSVAAKRGKEGRRARRRQELHVSDSPDNDCRVRRGDVTPVCGKYKTTSTQWLSTGLCQSRPMFCFLLRLSSVLPSVAVSLSLCARSSETGSSPGVNKETLSKERWGGAWKGVPLSHPTSSSRSCQYWVIPAFPIFWSFVAVNGLYTITYLIVRACIIILGGRRREWQRRRRYGFCAHNIITEFSFLFVLPSHFPLAASAQYSLSPGQFFSIYK